MDDDRYDLVECGAASQPTLTLDLSYQLRDKTVASLLRQQSVWAVLKLKWFSSIGAKYNGN